jgi:hypothetical protein
MILDHIYLCPNCNESASQARLTQVLSEGRIPLTTLVKVDDVSDSKDAETNTDVLPSQLYRHVSKMMHLINEYEKKKK